MNNTNTTSLQAQATADVERQEQLRDSLRYADALLRDTLLHAQRRYEAGGRTTDVLTDIDITPLLIGRALEFLDAATPVGDVLRYLTTLKTTDTREVH